MRQKVGIAMAYAKKAKVYLLDERSGLDPLANELSLLLKLVADGATILMASHDIFRVEKSAIALILKQGSLVKKFK